MEEIWFSKKLDYMTYLFVMNLSATIYPLPFLLPL